MENFKDLVGKVLLEVKGDLNDDRLVFTLENGDKYMLWHDQDCSESVTINDIVGELHDLVGSPILMAEEVTSTENPLDVSMENQDSFTWTFYKLATIKGYVTIRWYGESNGYYSESVFFDKVK